MILSCIALAITISALIYVLWSGHETRRIQREADIYLHLAAARTNRRRRTES